MPRLTGKNAIVTGAARGIGKEVALMYADAGARVMMVDVDADRIARTAERSEALSAIACDLTDETAVHGLRQAAEAELETVDILVNAAGLVRFARIEDMTKDDFDLTIQGEINTVFLTTRAIWPALLASRRASIVNFSSANAHTALNGLHAIAHTAGKGAVLAMTRQMAMEGGKHGIRANSIAPGFIVTEETEQHLETSLMASVRQKLMVDHLGTPRDVGHLAIYLGSDESRYVTGADFRIDGGATAW